MSPETAEVKRWIEKARNDRRAAEAALGLDPPVTDAAAFHCQQAVEKLLKAYLVWQRHEFEKIHDLRALANLCAQHDPTFTDLRDRAAPLTPYAVRFRYPGRADPSVEEVKDALGVVEEVRDLLRDRLPPDVAP